MNLIDPPTMTADDPIPGAPHYPCCDHCGGDVCGGRDGHTIPCVDGCNEKGSAA